MNISSNRNRAWQFCLALLFLLFCLTCTGCLGESRGEQNQQKAAYTVVDSRGKEVSFQQKPQRIISNSVFVDEMLLDMVDNKRLVALSKWVHDEELSYSHEQAKAVPTIVENNIEAVVKLQPDLVLLPDNAKEEFILGLEDMGMKVYVYKAIYSIHDIPSQLQELGAAVDERQRAATMVAQLESKLALYREKLKSLPEEKRPSALLIQSFGAIGGSGCVFHDVLQAAGIKDAYDKVRDSRVQLDGMQRILTKEEAVASNPDFIIMGGWSQGGKHKSQQEQFEAMYNDPAYASIEAVKQRHVIYVPASCVNCLSHNVVLGIEELHNAVYGK